MQLSGFELCFRIVEVVQPTPVEAAPQVRLPNSFLLLESLCRLWIVRPSGATMCHPRDQDLWKILEELWFFVVKFRTSGGIRSLQEGLVVYLSHLRYQFSHSFEFRYDPICCLGFVSSLKLANMQTHSHTHTYAHTHAHTSHTQSYTCFHQQSFTSKNAFSLAFHAYKACVRKIELCFASRTSLVSSN